MMTPVESFIHRENIKNFEKRLADPTTDEARRKMLATLLAEEKAKAERNEKAKVDRIWWRSQQPSR